MNTTERVSPAAVKLLSKLLGAEYEYLLQSCTDSEEDIARQEKALDELFTLLSTLKKR